MKKIFFFVFVLMPFAGSFAQFTVLPNGTACVSTQNGASAFAGVHNSIGVKGFRTSYNTGSDWGYGLYGESSNFYTHHSVGVAGIARTENGARYNNCKAYGVWGEAKLAETGYNYGVFGRLSDEYFGTAVYGTSRANDDGVQIGGRYAGYFNGNVHISDHLLAGSISAVNNLYVENWLVEADCAETANAVMTVDGSELLSDKIATLSAKTSISNEPDMVNAAETMMTTATLLNNETTLHTERVHYSLSAEQMETVFPELVYSKNGTDRYINYAELIPILVQSIAELKAEIAVLKGFAMGNILNKTRSNSTEIISLSDIDVICLSQNTPNPWSTSTDITINVPENVINAELYFYDLNGTLISSHNIFQRGMYHLTLLGSEFVPGIYVYALMADGKIIDTKRMIVEE